MSLRFVFPARSDVGSSRLDLAPSGPGIFTATGTNLSLDGTWRITVTVARGTSSVEVPLELTTRVSGPPAASPTPAVDVNAVAGLPTIYTVHLTAGRTVQVYLDPGKPGTNDVHVTFFDAAGNELPVPSVAMAFGPVGAQLAPLTPRELEPGHFVATTTVAVGTYSLSISGSAPNGDRLDDPGRHPRVQVRSSMSVVRRSFVLCVAAVLVGLTGCSSPSSSPASPDSATPTSAASAAASLSAPTPAGSRPSSPAVVAIVSPTQNAVISGSTAHIVITLKNAQIVPATTTNIRPDQGHVHLYVDNVARVDELRARAGPARPSGDVSPEGRVRRR